MQIKVLVRKIIGFDVLGDRLTLLEAIFVHISKTNIFGLNIGTVLHSMVQLVSLTVPASLNSFGEAVPKTLN